MLPPEDAVDSLDALLRVAVLVPVAVPVDSVEVDAMSVLPEAPVEEVAVARAVAVVEYCEARAQY